MSQKMSLLCLAITLTYMNRFERFLAEMLLRKYAIKICFIFPPHLTTASALPGKKTWKLCLSFPLNAACFLYQKTHKTNFKTSPGRRSHPSLSKRLTVCTRCDLGREPISSMLPLCLMFTKSVTVLATVSKIRVLLHQVCSESQQPVLLG